MLLAYVHRPVTVRAIQYAKDQSNRDELFQHFISEGTPCKMDIRAKHSIFIYINADMLYLNPGDYLVYVTGDPVPRVYREDEFLKRYRPQDEKVEHV